MADDRALAAHQRMMGRPGHDHVAQVLPTLRLFARLFTAAPYIVVSLVVAFLWQIRAEGHLSAESGLGYGLGIAGAAALVLLLGYPLRKRWILARGLGSLKGWFRLHMFLGVFGPALILAHSNFKLGSTNSTVALMCMLIVAGSGLFGRYFYSRIHRGLHGPRLTVKALYEAIETDSHKMAVMETLTPALRKDMLRLAADGCRLPDGLVAAFFKAVLIGTRTSFLRAKVTGCLRETLSAKAKDQGWTSRERRRRLDEEEREIQSYLSTIRCTAQLSFFERLFSLWHVLHTPLFFLMLVTAIVHIVAVHVY